MGSIIHIAAMAGGTALCVCLVSQLGLVLAYRAYHLRRFGMACDLPLFRLGRTAPTLVDNIKHLEFRDPLGWGLRIWLFLSYGGQLVLALSLAAFLIGLFAEH